MVRKVFKPGVFDLFHIGHLNSIQRAAECGDYLIVGVQDDRDVEACKGSKPVIPLQERMAIISAIKGVDEVISYRNANLSKLLSAFDIAVLAVGEDYGLTEFPEQKETLRYCETAGVDVRRTPRTECVSTSDIKQGASYRQIANARKDVCGFWDNVSSINQGSSESTMLTSFGGNSELIEQENKREIDLFSRYILPRDSVLELGCGNGRILTELAKISNIVVGVDFSKTLIDKLNGFNLDNLEAVCSDVCSYDAGRRFNVIVLSGLFPCLDNEQYHQVLDSCSRHIEKKGCILVRTSFADEERINVVNQFSEQLGTLYTAYYRTKDEIIESMFHAGFQPQEYQFLYRNHPDTHIGFMSFIAR
jgi:glycerol-3-phosphate cytidylyltransferase